MRRASFRITKEMLADEEAQRAELSKHKPLVVFSEHLKAREVVVDLLLTQIKVRLDTSKPE